MLKLCPHFKMGKVHIVLNSLPWQRQIDYHRSGFLHLCHLYTLAKSIKKTSKSCADDSKASLIWVKKRTEHDPTLSPNLFSGHPRHGAVGQNIFSMYISIKRHSWFFKSWWCLLYFGHVRMGTAAKTWRHFVWNCPQMRKRVSYPVV